MAVISTADTGKVYRLTKWLGLNESPDGDTALNMGEAALMRNFRVTREGHLQLRPGSSTLCTLGEGPVQGLFCGYVGAQLRLLAACGGQLWHINTEKFYATCLGYIPDAPTQFFGFGGKVYILTGQGYHCWSGAGQVAAVEGYVPLVAVAVPPEGGGTALERVNLLTGKRRVRFSPDGVSTLYRLPETDLDEILSAQGTDIEWTADPQAGTLTFAEPPAAGVDCLTVTYRKGEGDPAKVQGMRFGEIYNGSTDARVFLYGDGTNDAIYSDLDEYGVPTAEYFPDMNIMAVDSANTPVTAMVRHYDRLMVYKSDGAFCIQQGSLTLDTGEVTAAFTCVPVNRNIGCSPWGQACLVENDPVTLYEGGVYRWSLSGAGSRDERNAKHIGGRVQATLSALSMQDCLTFDDEPEQELYILHQDTALVYHYGADAWYTYQGLRVRCMARCGQLLCLGTDDGRLLHFSRVWHSDDGVAIDARWESGNMDFALDHRRKYSGELWVSMKPEGQARVSVTAQSDRKSVHTEKELAYSLATFANAGFPHWSFNTCRRPKVFRVRLKVKKFTYCKLIFTSCSNLATATVLGAGIRIRYAGFVK